MLSISIKSLFLVLFVISSSFFTSCKKESIRGSGSIGSRAITLQTFTSVESHYDIKAVISYGPTQEIIAKGYDNLLNILDCKVENGVLKLKFNTNYNTIRNGNVVVNIKIPIL